MKNKKQSKPQIEIAPTAPIVIQQNSVIKEKMLAIVNLSETVLELSKALNGVNTEIRVERNTFQNCGTALQLNPE